MSRKLVMFNLKSRTILFPFLHTYCKILHTNSTTSLSAFYHQHLAQFIPAKLELIFILLFLIHVYLMKCQFLPDQNEENHSFSLNMKDMLLYPEFFKCKTHYFLEFFLQFIFLLYHFCAISLKVKFMTNFYVNLHLNIPLYIYFLFLQLGSFSLYLMDSKNTRLILMLIIIWIEGNRVHR